MSVFGLELVEEMEEKYLEDIEFDGGMEDFEITDEEMELTEVTEKKRKKVKSEKFGGEPVKKKDREYEEKKKIALEVSKFPNIFDVTNTSFCDKQLQNATWKKISAAVDLPVEKCVAHWNSLKRSAKYYANEQEIPYKSGSSADEMSVQTYRSKWPFRDFMAFYTPPSLRESPKSIVLSNVQLKSQRSSPNLTDPISPLSVSTEQAESVFFGDDFCYDQTPPPKGKLKKDQLAESVSMMANSFSSYLQYKSLPQEQPMESAAKPTLKYMEMWSNFDRLVSKLDEDTVDDLNIEISNLIGAALKKKRKNS